MKNFKTLLLNEFMQQISSFRFVLSLFVTFIVTVVCVYVQVQDFADRQQTYQAEQTKALNESKQARIYSEFKVPVFIKQNPLSIFSKGFDEKAGNYSNISVFELPELKSSSQKSNPFMEILENFDVLSIVGIILSLVALFIVGDIISGERENETLKLVFGNQVSRTEYFLAKYVGNLITLVFPLIMVFLITSLFIVLHPLIMLTGLQWLKIIMLFFSGICYLSVFILIGLTISCRVFPAAKAIMVCLVVWIAMVNIYPNLVNYMVSSLVKVPETHQLNAVIDQLNSEKQKIFDENDKKTNTRHVSCSWCNAGSIVEMALLGNKEFILNSEKRNALNIPVHFEYQGKINAEKKQFKQQLFHQQKAGSYFLQLLPNFQLSDGCSVIASTDFQSRDLQLHNSLEIYRTTIMDYIKSKSGFGFKFFTLMKPEQLKDNFSDYTNEEKELYTNHKQQLDISDTPQFYFKDKIKIPVDMLYLVVLNVVFIALGLRLFTSARVH
jgi:ABC-type transport system involved in multi-copper enzyme maturation permease subunit